jgi:hypothetical protein
MAPDHGERERDEEELDDAAQEDDRDEHDADRQGRHEGGHGDLLGAVQDGGHDGLAHPEVAVDVLDLDGSIVDQDAHGEGQASQRHDVDRVAEPAQHDERRQDGQGNGRGHDDRAPPAPQEHQDHQGGQRGRDHCLAHHAVDGRADKHGLIEELADLELGRQRRLHLGQYGLDALHDVQGGRSPAFEDRQQARPVTALADDVRLDREAVVHLGHVPDVDQGTLHLPDGQIVQGLHGGRAAVEQHVVFRVPDLGRAGGEDEVLSADGIDDVRRRQPVRLQGLRVQVDHDLPRLPTVGQRHGGSLHGGELGADEVLRVVEELLLRQRLARDGELQDRHAGRAVADYQGRRHPLRQEPKQGLHERGHLGLGHGGVGTLVKVDLDHAHPVHGLGLHVLDVVDGGGHGPLRHREYALFHVVR